jgi:hypothetical protein
LPGWLQAGVLLLLLWNGLQAIIHHNGSSSTATANQTAPSTTARVDYYYTPDRLNTTGNMQPTFQYAGYYAHAASAMKVMPMKAQDVSAGRWVERDPFPAK